MLALTLERWRELLEVNARINRRPYRVDLSLYGREDHWTPITDAGGDCEDYALAKQAELLALGWPLETLRLATCHTERGEYHAVLTVDTEVGTYVLDNRRIQPTPWENLVAAGYQFDRRQAVAGRGWVDVMAS